MKNKRLITKAIKLKERIRILQRDLYDFQIELEERGIKEEVAQLASNAGFEMDVSQQQMEYLSNDLAN